MPRHRHAPIEIGAAHGKILEAGAHETRHLVAPGLGADEVGLRLVEGQQPVLIGREAKEEVLLLHPGHRRAGDLGDRCAIGAGLEFVLGVVGLVAHRVPAGVLRQVEVAVRLHPAPQLLRGSVMRGLGGADEVVLAAIQRLCHGAEARRHLVHEFAGRHAGPGRRLLNLDAVLVGAGGEQHVVAVDALEARDRVRGDHLVGVADMRRAVGVGDRGGEAEGLGRHAGKPRQTEGDGQGISLRPAPVIPRLRANPAGRGHPRRSDRFPLSARARAGSRCAQPSRLRHHRRRPEPEPRRRDRDPVGYQIGRSRSCCARPMLMKASRPTAS